MAKEIIRQPNKKAKILKSEIIYEGKAFGVRRDELIEPTGVRTIREVVTHPGSVVVLPVLPDGRIVLVRQYRHATRQYLWELVAGRMERGENPKTGAQRELIEETGYRAKKFTVFLDVFRLPVFSRNACTSCWPKAFRRPSPAGRRRKNRRGCLYPQAVGTNDSHRQIEGRQVHRRAAVLFFVSCKVNS